MPDLPSAFLRPFPASEIFHRRFVARIAVWCRLVAFRTVSMKPTTTMLPNFFLNGSAYCILNIKNEGSGGEEVIATVK